jgi:predicted membrane protein
MSLLYLVLALVIVAIAARYINTEAGMPDKAKPVVNLVLALIVVGMLLWLINTYIPMAESIKTILNIVVVVATCVFVLQTLGLWNRIVAMGNTLWANINRPRPPENPKPTEQH